MSQTNSHLKFTISAKDVNASSTFARIGKQLDGIKKQLGPRGAFKDVGELLKGGGAIAGVTFLARAIGDAADKAYDLADQFRAGELSATDLAGELTRSVPILGSMVKMWDSILGSTRESRKELEKLNAENAKTKAIQDARDKDRQRGADLLSGLDFSGRARDRLIGRTKDPVKTMYSAFAKIGDDLAKLDNMLGDDGKQMLREIEALIVERDEKIRKFGTLPGAGSILNLPPDQLKILARAGALAGSDKRHKEWARNAGVEPNQLGELAQQELALRDERDRALRDISDVKMSLKTKQQSIAPALQKLEKEKIDTLVFAGEQMLENLGDVFRNWDVKGVSTKVFSDLQQKQDDFIRMISDQAVEIASEQAETLANAAERNRERRESDLVRQLEALEKQRNGSRGGAGENARQGALSMGASLGLVPRLNSMTRQSFDPNMMHRETMKKMDEQIAQLKEAVRELRKGNEPAPAIFN